MSIKKKVHIIRAWLLKTRQLLKVCVEHSTHRWERWDQVVKFPPYKGQTTVSSSSLNTVALMQLDWLWFCNRMSQNDIIRFHSINLTSNSSCVWYPSRWRSLKNMMKLQKIGAISTQGWNFKLSGRAAAFLHVQPHPVLLQSGQWLVDAVDKFVDMFKVLGHLCCEHHINDSLS